MLASGSDGNSTLLCADETMIMVDAGLSGRSLERLMNKVGIEPSQLSGIFLTHEHSDHVKGAGILSRRYGIPILCNEWTFRASNIGQVERFIPFETMRPFRHGRFDVLPIPIMHRAAEPNAFHISCGDKKCLIATDLGVVTAPVFCALRDTHLAMIESNYDLHMLIHGTYPPAQKEEIRSEKGHLSNLDCARALWATHSEERKVFLVHLSKDNNTPRLARKTVAKTLGCDDDEIDCLNEPGDVRTISLL